MSINEKYLLDNNMTEDQYVAKVYSLTLDSVVLINRIASGERQSKDPVGDITRNVQYLEHIISQPFWTDQDLSPLTDAITTGKNYLDSLPQ